MSKNQLYQNGEAALRLTGQSRVTAEADLVYGGFGDGIEMLNSSGTLSGLEVCHGPLPVVRRTGCVWGGGGGGGRALLEGEGGHQGSPRAVAERSQGM